MVALQAGVLMLRVLPFLTGTYPPWRPWQFLNVAPLPEHSMPAAFAVDGETEAPRWQHDH